MTASADFSTNPETPPAKTEALTDLFRQLRNLSRDVLYYGIGGTFGQLIGFITVPILTRVFTVNEYGAIDLIINLDALVFLTASLNIGYGELRLYYDLPPEDRDTQNVLISTITLVYATVIALFPILVSIFSPQISTVLFGSVERTEAVRIGLIAQTVQLLWAQFVLVQRIFRRPKQYVFLNLGNTVVNFIALIILVVAFRTGLPGYFWAQVVGWGMMAAWGFYLTRADLKPKFSWKLLSAAAVLGVPAFPSMVFNWITTASNRFFLNLFSGVEQVGYFILVHKVTLPLLLIFMAFSLAWEPYLLTILRRPNVSEICRSVLKYYTLLILALGGCLIFFAREVFFIFAPANYQAGVPAVGIYVLRHLFLGMMGVTNAGIGVAKKPVYVSVIYGSGALVVIAMNLVLTRHLGLFGAALAEMLGFMTCFAVSYYFSVRFFPIKWDLKGPFLAICVFIVAALASVAIFKAGLPTWQSLLVNSALCGLYLVILSRFIEPDHRYFIFQKAPRIFIDQVRSRLGKPPRAS